MATGLLELFSGKAEVESLLKAYGGWSYRTNKFDNRSTNSSWLAPKDRTVLITRLDKVRAAIASADLSSTCDQKFSTINKIPELLQYCSNYAGTLLKDIRERNLVHRVCVFGTSLVQMEPVGYPAQVSECPSLDKIKARLADESLIVTVNTYSGYSFSAEYTHVYKGKFNKAHAHPDTLALLRRALRCIDPTISNAKAERFATYILQSAAWEADGLAASVCEESVKSCFPNWKEDHYPGAQLAASSFHHVEVFVGRDDDSRSSHEASRGSSGYVPSGGLTFTVRLYVDLEPRFTPDQLAQRKKQRQQQQESGNSSADEAAAAMRENTENPFVEEDSLSFVYYRSFELTDDAVDTYVGPLGQGAAPPPPPPPPPPRKSKVRADGGLRGPEEANPVAEEDIRLLLIVPTRTRSQLRAAEGATDENHSGDAAIIHSGTHGDSNKESSRDSNRPGYSHSQTAAPIWEAEIALRRRQQEQSHCAELLGWGFDASRSLGVGSCSSATRAVLESQLRRKEFQSNKKSEEAATAAEVEELVYGPRVVPVGRMISLERVSSIACSARHTLLLTFGGSLFSCGDNAEGALGTGDFTSRSSFLPVVWPEEGSSNSSSSRKDIGAIAPKVVKIAAGSSSIGSHSMAIDDAGSLYGWGVAYAAGLGVVKAVTAPTHVPVATARLKSSAEGATGGLWRAGERPSLRGMLRRTFRSHSVAREHQDNEEEEEEDDEEIVLDLEESNYAAGETARAGAGAGASDAGHISAPTTAELREVVDVACGGGFTVCVTKAGRVYSWGMWAHGRLGLGPVPAVDSMRGPYRRTAKKVARYQLHPRRVPGVEGAMSVSCGEAHTLCLLRTGALLAWGQNSCGQVGCGPSSSGYLGDCMRPVLVPPFLGQLASSDRANVMSSTETSTGPPQLCLQRFVMRYGSAAYHSQLPALSEGSSPPPTAVGRLIVCGAFHSLCVDEQGQCWSWGARGSPCLGHCDSPVMGEWSSRINGLFSIASAQARAMIPFELLPWATSWAVPRPIHTFSRRKPFTSQPAASDAASVRSGSSYSGSYVPQQAHRVVQVTAGDLSSAFLTADGSFFLCGTGPSVPDFLPDSRLTLDDEEREQEMGLKAGGRSGAAVDTAALEDQHQRLAKLVTSPRSPSDCWMRELCTRRVRYIAGGGSRLFVLADEECVSSALTTGLLHCLFNGRLNPMQGRGKDSHLVVSAARSDVGGVSDLSSAEDDDSHYSHGHAATLERADDLQYFPRAGSGVREDGSSSGASASASAASIFEARGRADCMLLASGKVFLCHKALLAQRSPELREMILMESPTPTAGSAWAGALGSGAGGMDSRSTASARSMLVQPVQILLPELQRDTARALMYFLYRDVLPSWCVGNVTLLTSLERTGRTLRMPRLQLLSKYFLTLLKRAAPRSGTSLPQQASGAIGEMGETAGLELPPPTLARDLGSMVGDGQWADVRFIAEGRAIAAHRFILESRCAYFAAMFRSGMAEGANSGFIADVVVPDTFVGFLRLLLFIYTNTLPDGSDGALLEDLMAADRYDLPDMKALCESMLMPSTHNWLDLLRAAELLGAHSLRVQVMAFLRDHFHVLQSLFQAPPPPPSAASPEDSVELDPVSGRCGGGLNPGRGQQEEQNNNEKKKEEEEEGEGEGKEEEKEEEEVPLHMSMDNFRAEFPGVLEQLLAERAQHFPTPPSQQMLAQTSKSNEAEAASTSQDAPAFPIWALLVAAVSLLLYQHVSRIVALGPLVPVLNLIGIVVLALYGYKMITG